MFKQVELRLHFNMLKWWSIHRPHLNAKHKHNTEAQPLCCATNDKDKETP